MKSDIHEKTCWIVNASTLPGSGAFYDSPPATLLEYEEGLCYVCIEAGGEKSDHEIRVVKEVEDEYRIYGVIKKEGNWWIGWVEEIPGVNCQEHTKEELLESLEITLKEALEFNRQALSAAGDDFKEVKLAI